MVTMAFVTLFLSILFLFLVGLTSGSCGQDGDICPVLSSPLPPPNTNPFISVVTKFSTVLTTIPTTIVRVSTAPTVTSIVQVFSTTTLTSTSLVIITTEKTSTVTLSSVTTIFPVRTFVIDSLSTVTQFITTTLTTLTDSTTTTTLRTSTSTISRTLTRTLVITTRTTSFVVSTSTTSTTTTTTSLSIIPSILTVPYTFTYNYPSYTFDTSTSTVFAMSTSTVTQVSQTVSLPIEFPQTFVATTLITVRSFFSIITISTATVATVIESGAGTASVTEFITTSILIPMAP